MGRLILLVIILAIIWLFIKLIAFISRSIFGIIAMIFSKRKNNAFSDNRFENLGRRM